MYTYQSYTSTQLEHRDFRWQTMTFALFSFWGAFQVSEILYFVHMSIHLSNYLYLCYILFLHIHTWWTTSSSHRSESKMPRKPSHNESECLESTTKGQFLQGKDTSMLFLNLSALRRHLPSYTSAFKLSLFGNVHDDGSSAIKSRCICNL